MEGGGERKGKREIEEGREREERWGGGRGGGMGWHYYIMR